VLFVASLKRVGVTCSNDKRGREVSGVKLENGEERLGVQMNLAVKLSLEKGMIDPLNICPFLFPGT